MGMHFIFCTSSYKAYLKKKKNCPGHGILIKKWLENLSCAKNYSWSTCAKDYFFSQLFSVQSQ